MEEDWRSDPKFFRFIKHRLNRQRAKESEEWWASEDAEAWRASIEQAMAKRPDTVIFYHAGAGCLYLLHVPHTLNDYEAVIFGDDEN